MSLPTTELLDLQNDVISYFQKIQSKFPEEIYYDIFQSPFHSPADVLFLGINPGSGSQEMEVKPKEKFDYLVWNYNLARDTREVFELAGYSHLLQEKAVKSNIFYWTTKDVSSLNNYRAQLNAFSMREEYYQKTLEWTRIMVNITKPSLVICEGVMAFNEFLVAMDQKHKILSIIRGHF